MKRLASSLLAFAALFAGAAGAQDQPSGFYSVDCLKLHPGKAQEFREFNASHISKVMNAGLQNGDFGAWYLLRSVFPAGSEARCDYLRVLTYKTTPPAPIGGQRLADAIKKSGIDLSPSDFFAKRSTLATLVSSELWRSVILLSAPEKGDYMYVNSMKVHNMSEWMDIEQRIWKPMVESWIKSGGMRSWMVSRPVLPGGTDLKYQAITVDVFPSWEEAIKGRQVGETFKKLHPTKDMTTTFEHITKSRDLARRELLYVEDKSASGPAAVVSQK